MSLRRLNSCYASDAVWVYLHDPCVSASMCICMDVSYIVRVCVCVDVCVRLLAGGSKQKKQTNKKQQNQNGQQNGIIIADILKNKQTQTVQGLWYYSDNKATFSRWVLSCSGGFFFCCSFFPSSKKVSAVIASNGNREAKRGMEEEVESWFARRRSEHQSAPHQRTFRKWAV